MRGGRRGHSQTSHLVFVSWREEVERDGEEREEGWAMLAKGKRQRGDKYHQL